MGGRYAEKSGPLQADLKSGYQNFTLGRPLAAFLRWEAFIISKGGRGAGKYPTEQAVINEIRRRYFARLPMNYNAIRIEDDALRRRSTALFGGYKFAVEAAGFNYEKCRVDTNTASYYGIVFEELVKELFDKLRIAYGEPNDTRYRPDIILRYKRWIDVKLSEWSVDNRDCGTIEKYLPHCRQLTIIYLRGRSGERMYNGTVRLINAREYVKQLPRKDRGYFYVQFNEIEAKLNDIETKVS